MTFTRSNPAADVDGVGASVVHKHWGCRGPLVIDARIKPHHAPPLEEDPAVERRVDALFASRSPRYPGVRFRRAGYKRAPMDLLDNLPRALTATGPRGLMWWHLAVAAGDRLHRRAGGHRARPVHRLAC